MLGAEFHNTPRMPTIQVRPKSFYLRQLPADLFVGRPLFIIHFDKFPAHHPLRVDNKGRWMWPAAAVRIENPVTIDHFVVFVFEQRKIELAIESLAQHLAEFF